MTLRAKAAIVGIGELPPARYTEGETSLGILAKAGTRAVEDAGLPFGDVDGMIVHPIGGITMLAPSTLLEFMGLEVSFAESVDLGGATGAGMVWRAAAAIQAGMCNVCLCMTGSRRERRIPGRRGGGGRMRDTSPSGEFEVPYGAVGANFGYAMIAQRYLHEYDVTPEQLARIAVHQRDNACAIRLPRSTRRSVGRRPFSVP